MLMEVKSQLKVTLLSVKYALMREMLNKTTFLTNITFMILNNASFIIQWIVLYSIKDNVGGYTLKQVLLLWGLAAGTFGVSRFFFKNAFSLADTINNGKLDSYLVQPKNVLISAITSNVEASAIGDLIYAYIMLVVFGINISNFIMFTFFSVMGGFVLTAIAVILGSLSFWFNKTDVVADVGNSLVTNFATYPDGIFEGVAKVLLYTVIPVGLINYLPIKIITEFNLSLLLIVSIVMIIIILLAFFVFYKGLKRYSSSNLMIAKF